MARRGGARVPDAIKNTAMELGLNVLQMKTEGPTPLFPEMPDLPPFKWEQSDAIMVQMHRTLVKGGTNTHSYLTHATLAHEIDRYSDRYAGASKGGVPVAKVLEGQMKTALLPRELGTRRGALRPAKRRRQNSIDEGFALLAEKEKKVEGTEGDEEPKGDDLGPVVEEEEDHEDYNDYAVNYYDSDADDGDGGAGGEAEY